MSVTAAAALLSGCGGGQLSVDVEQAHSIAAAGQLLASEAAEGKATGPYVRAQSEELARSADELARRIRSDSGDARERSHAAAVADTTADGMRALARQPDDPGTAVRVDASLREAMR